MNRSTNGAVYALISRLIPGMNLPGEDKALLASTAGSLVVRLLGMSASFAMGVLLARQLNPDGFGVYGIVIALALMLSVIAQFGLPTIATREVSVAFAEQRWGTLRGYLWRFGAIVTASSAGLAIVWACMAILFPKLTGAPTANLIGSMLVPLFALTVLVSAELRALDRIVAGQALEVLVRPALMCVILYIAYSWEGGLSAPVAVGVNVLASTVTIIAGLVLLRSVMPLAASNSTVEQPRRWFKPALALASVDVLKQLDVTYGMLLLGVLSSKAEAGYFRVALSTIIFVSTPLSIVNVVLAPTLARLAAAGDRGRLQRLMAISALAMFATAIVALAAILLIGKPLIALVFGASYEPAWLPLVLLTCAQAINGFFGVGWVLLSMSGGERRLTASFVLSVGASIVAAIPLTMVAGAAGAAGAAIIGALIQNLFAWRSVHLHSSLECSAAGILLRTRGVGRHLRR